MPITNHYHRYRLKYRGIAFNQGDLTGDGEGGKLLGKRSISEIICATSKHEIKCVVFAMERGASREASRRRLLFVFS